VPNTQKTRGSKSLNGEHVCTPLWWNWAGTSNRQENEEARLAAILVLQIGKIDVRIRGFDWTILQDFRPDVEAEDLSRSGSRTIHERTGY
jgi:hypothetical protein